jgi:hypothetical protein
MPGELGLSSPWAREGISKADRADVEAAIPDGWTLGVAVSPNKDKWVFWTKDPDGNISHKTHVSHHMALRAACFFVLNHRGLTVDTVAVIDPEGYVRSLTDAD